MKATEEQSGGTHYVRMSIQPAVFSEVNRLTFLEGSIIKRICRHDTDTTKYGPADLEKAIHEIRLILELRYGIEK